MRQLEIDGMNTGILKDGTEIKNGDIIEYNIAMNYGITKVVLYNGKLCMQENLMYGYNTPIDNFLKNAGYNEVRKISLVDVYKKCKANNWNTGKYIEKLSKNI